MTAVRLLFIQQFFNTLTGVIPEIHNTLTGVIPEIHNTLTGVIPEIYNTLTEINGMTAVRLSFISREFSSCKVVKIKKRPRLAGLIFGFNIYLKTLSVAGGGGLDFWRPHNPPGRQRTGWHGELPEAVSQGWGFRNPRRCRK